MRVERDDSNCEPCFFLGDIGNEPVCIRLKKLIKDVENCDSGILIPFPQNAEEYMDLHREVEKRWRKGK